MKNTDKDLTKSCILCSSNNIKIIHEGIETDTYKCLKCKRRYGVSDLRRIAGFTKREIEKMDRKNKKSKNRKNP